MSPATNAPITVLIVDDSPFMRLTLQKILNQDSEIKVLDTARDGREGIEKLQSLQPQVITMDVEMPVMDGLQALDEIMRWKPTPVIILSAVTTEGTQATMKALDYGAFDVVAKPSGKPGGDLQALARDLIEKVKGAAQVDPARLGKNGAARRSVLKNTQAPSAQLLGGSPPPPLNRSPSPVSGSVENKPTSSRPVVRSETGNVYPKSPVEIVAIGTSTGGPTALQNVLPHLPGHFPVPVIVAQHMPPGFTGPLAQRLNGLCALNVREGIHGELLRAGTIYVAPAGKQIQVLRRNGQLVLQIGDESPISTLYHPSVDVMFLSLAKAVGKGALGVVMTGMGSDGLKGMREIKAHEGFAIAEAEETCVVYGMPRAIIEAGLADRITPLTEIGRAIVECVQRKEL